MRKSKLMTLAIALSIMAIVIVGCPTNDKDDNGNSDTPPSPDQYTLSTSVSPGSAGTVTPSSGTYEDGTQVSLTAHNAQGYTFDHWSGDASGFLPAITLTMNSNKNVIANFKINEPEPIEFSGKGDDVSSKFTLEPGITIFTIEHDGDSNFAIWLLDDTGGLVDLLVNEIGDFDGSMAIGVKGDNFIGAKPGTHLLNITADGKWTVLIEQPRPTSAATVPLNISGRGCDASPFFMLDGGLTIFTMTHDGDSNFIIWLLSSNGDIIDLLVNEIGSYSGTQAIGANPGIHILSITADGKWTVSISK